MNVSRRYHHNPPRAYLLYQRLDISLGSSGLLPHPDLSIVDFVQFKIPTQANVHIPTPASKSFSRQLPNHTLDDLRNRLIPPQHWIDDLGKHIELAVVDGAQSIVDPRETNLHVPLKGYTYWKEGARVSRKVSLWEAGFAWLSKCSTVHTLTNAATDVDGAIQVLRGMGWDQSLHVVGEGVGLETLLCLLADGHDGWLNDDTINAAMRDLSSRAHLSPAHADNVVVAPTHFANGLVSTYLNTNANKQMNAYLKCYQKLFEGPQPRRRFLYLPANIDEEHWVPILVDFPKKAISYGASSEVVDALQDWLLAAFGSRFEDRGNSLPHGVQADASSCGICTVNTIAHDLFGDSLFTHRQRHSERIRLFTRICQQQLSLAEGTVGEHHASSSRSHHHHPPSTSHTTRHPPPPMHHCSHHEPFSDDLPIGLDIANEILAQFADHLAAELGPDAGADIPGLDGPIEDVPETDVDDLSSEYTDGDLSSESGWSSDGDWTSEPEEITLSDAASDTESWDDLAMDKGTSLSARNEQALKKAMKDGNLEVDERKKRTYEQTCRGVDEHCRFHYVRRWRVYHSRCRCWVTQKGPYNTQRFRAHAKKCKPKGQTHTLDGFVIRGPAGPPSDDIPPPPDDDDSDSDDSDDDEEGKGGMKVTSDGKGKMEVNNKKRPAREPRPCLGISGADDSRVNVYLRRTGAHGGGGRSRHDLALNLYQLPFGSLTDAQKDTVILAQRHSQTWVNDHQRLRVFARDCDGVVQPRQPAGTRKCPHCQAVFRSKSFRNRLRARVLPMYGYRDSSESQVSRVLVLIYRSMAVAVVFCPCRARERVCVRFAKLVLDGAFDDKEVTTGMVEAMVEAHDRRERGVGLQNFPYAEEFKRFMHELAVTSPEMYRSLAKEIQVPTIRHFQQQRSREAPFPLEAGDANVSRALTYLDAIAYKGPVAMSVDDTKLEPSLSLIWDPARESYLLIGSEDGPLAVSDPDELGDLLEQHKDKKATKLRLWTLQVPLPDVPPLILAVQAISSSMPARELAPLSLTLIRGLTKNGVKLVSYACDGADTERLSQRILSMNADDHITHTITNPLPNHADYVLHIPVFNGQPVVMMQDSKHACKNCRNGCFTGARCLVLGNHLAMYAYARDLAFHPEGPLRRRDVERLDRQDDRAATRMFCATTLEFLTEKYPKRAGMIVWMFVAGEIVDAYQNRDLPPMERLVMVLRAKSFLELWRIFLDTMGYSEQRYFISHDLHDILNTLADALMRKVKPDFTLRDFVYMRAKVERLTRRFADSVSKGDSAGAAQGYSHTWWARPEVDLAKLAVFPSDEGINAAARLAGDEALALFNMLDVNPSDFLEGTPHPLPSIDTWFAAGEDPVPLPSGKSGRQALQEAIDAQCASLDSMPKDVATEVKSLTYAAVALGLDDDENLLDDSEDPSPEEDAVMAQRDSRRIDDVLNGVRDVKRVLVDEPEVHYEVFDMTALVALRRRHETPWARTCARKNTRSKKGKGVVDETDDDAATDNNVAAAGGPDKEAMRQELARRLTNVMRNHREDEALDGTTTGGNRRIRTAGQVRLTGNSLNAELAAGTRAVEVKKLRSRVFSQHDLAPVADIVDACIDARNAKPGREPLVPNAYALVLVAEDVWIGRVMAIYSQGGSTSMPHAWQERIDSVGLASYIVLQLYEPGIVRHVFRGVHDSAKALGAFRFAHVPVVHFLQRVPGPFSLSADDRSLIVNHAALGMLVNWRGQRRSLLTAVVDYNKEARKSKKKGKPDTK
ncbi:hypothetical protein CONPUDRAFT_131026 [Coniophora puteana RWD-64-598 SS2]|uniref:Ubiquitin-like protease family profile domain-containing protein n=1 Tax=Coniophora puteana (strain RWD-64-598) TaxID=741705 RepID=A0A5M3MCQ1_CONPW|nr:uncharacterized protein CONPUDRAFT_131026 [Coniophora puteana RWD-64-598 SS2]EIW76421.1 hypothetical protein CONPUDRAFT_131026 [Coniophora puteana RWD-64-598 SS2]